MEKLNKDDIKQILAEGTGEGLNHLLDTLDAYEYARTDRYRVKTLLGKDSTALRTMKRFQLMWHQGVLDDECYLALMCNAYKERVRDFANEGRLPAEAVDDPAVKRVIKSMAEQHVGYMHEHHSDERPEQPVELYGC